MEVARIKKALGVVVGVLLLLAGAAFFVSNVTSAPAMFRNRLPGFADWLAAVSVLLVLFGIAMAFMFAGFRLVRSGLSKVVSSGAPTGRVRVSSWLPWAAIVVTLGITLLLKVDLGFGAVYIFFYVLLGVPAALVASVLGGGDLKFVINLLVILVGAALVLLQLLVALGPAFGI